MSTQELRSTPPNNVVAAPIIEPVEAESLSQLQSQPLGRLGLKSDRSRLDLASNLSLTVNGTGEIVEARPWRNRRDILEVVELTRGPNSTRLLNDLIQRFAAGGGHLIVVCFKLFSASKSIFRHAGFTLLEEIIEMASGHPWFTAYKPDFALNFKPERDSTKLITIDRKAFSWLWRNSEDEMSHYLKQAGVRAFTADANGCVAGYISYTLHRNFAHIDRIAVSPDQQGRGIGKALISWGLSEIRGADTENVILTTQRTNTRSQNLYRRFGFTETRRDYSIHGKWL